MKKNQYPHVNTPDRRPQWMKDMERENLQMLEDATTQAPESRDLPEAEQGPQNIPRFLTIGMIDDPLNF